MLPWSSEPFIHGFDTFPQGCHDVPESYQPELEPKPAQMPAACAKVDLPAPCGTGLPPSGGTWYYLMLPPGWGMGEGGLSVRGVVVQSTGRLLTAGVAVGGSVTLGVPPPILYRYQASCDTCIN